MLGPCGASVSVPFWQCSSVTILGRREQLFSEHLLCAIPYLMFLQWPSEAGVIIQERHLASAPQSMICRNRFKPGPPVLKALALSAAHGVASYRPLAQPLS